jgi:transcriptional regulator with XRE-family HTH domain
MVRQPEAVMKLRREIGTALAAYLEASPLSQSDLARVTGYHRTSISHVQAGRQFPEREFWEKADNALGAGGELVVHYNNVCDQKVAQSLKGVAGSNPNGVRYAIGSAPIDVDYVEELHKAIKYFVRLDQHYGGVAASPIILQAYKQMCRRVKTSEIRNGLRRDVYSALSEVAEVAGWSLYDSESDELTERVNHESLSLARMAGDRSMELFVLQNMSMHAETIGRPRESINISHLVLETNRLSPRLEALFRLRLARSYGRIQAEGEARRQLERARVLFEDGVSEDDPHWSWWINDPQMWWFEGSVRLNLGKRVESVEFFELSANAVSEPRMSFVYRSWALFGYALNGSWSNVDRSLRGLISDVGIFRSGIAGRRLAYVVDLIERGNAPSTVRDLGSALRAALTNAAQHSSRNFVIFTSSDRHAGSGACGDE